MTDLLLRIVALGIFIFWGIYWLITERSADREKPKMKHIPLLHRDNVRKLVLRFAELILILQLLGFPVLQIPNASIFVQVVGLILVTLDACVAISARKTLGTNWAHAFEYQVKQKQELVTTRIYSFIRHPIYTGLILAFIGGELAAKSYLVVLGLVLALGACHQAKLEEKLLTEHFGDLYAKYIKRTKIFIPYLW